MARKAIALTIIALVASVFTGCDKAPGGVIPESEMVHVLADFAKAEAFIEQYPNKFPDDSSKLALKQSILKKYDADLAMYDSSLVWYAHNIKLYSELHDKAVILLEKEGNIKHTDNAQGNVWLNNNTSPSSTQAGATRRVYPATGDSANLWTEPQQWLLTSAMHRGFITFDYAADKESRKGDLYSLNLKAINSSGNKIKIMLAIDYNDMTTSYINRTININGWSNYDIQADSTRVAKRIYGYISYNIKPKQVTFIDSIYLLRTHLNRDNYHRFSVQHMAGPKAALARDSLQQNKPPVSTLPPDAFPGRPQRDGQGPSSNTPPKFPGRPTLEGPAPIGHTRRNGDTTFRPKPGLNKSVIPSRERIPNPNGDHTPHPPIK